MQSVTQMLGPLGSSKHREARDSRTLRRNGPLRNGTVTVRASIRIESVVTMSLRSVMSSAAPDSARIVMRPGAVRRLIDPGLDPRHRPGNHGIARRGRDPIGSGRDREGTRRSRSRP